MKLDIHSIKTLLDLTTFIKRLYVLRPVLKKYSLKLITVNLPMLS